MGSYTVTSIPAITIEIKIIIKRSTIKGFAATPLHKIRLHLQMI